VIAPRSIQGVLAALIACALLAVPAGAATFKPTRKDDPVPNGCRPHNCSLREAISAANRDDGRDRVLLGRGRYRMELPDNGNDDNGNGDFDVLNSTLIAGSGPKKTIVDGQGIDRVFSFLTFDARTLTNLTITGGADSTGGGIIIGPSDATIRNVTIRGNTATGSGGGLYSVSPDLELDHVRLRDNEAGARGGGAALGVSIADVNASIRDSKVAGNDATDGAGIAMDETDELGAPNKLAVTVARSTIEQNIATRAGGGIASEASELTITRSTIAANTASEGGGIDLRPAVMGASSDPRVTRIRSSTIGPANDATNKAGGIMVDGIHFTGANLGGDPELHLANSTVALNSADNEAGGIMGDNLATVDVGNSSIGFNKANDDNIGIAVAGGVYQHSNANFSVDDSIIAHNEVGQGGTNPDCSATQVFSGAGNAISSRDGCEVSFTTPFNVYSDEAIANQLADNGGRTQTMSIPSSSAAVGFANLCPKRDQRGRLRPADCDSGAFENEPRQG
jgi:CSLREA domain-containing protein